MIGKEAFASWVRNITFEERRQILNNGTLVDALRFQYLRIYKFLGKWRVGGRHHFFIGLLISNSQSRDRSGCFRSSPRYLVLRDESSSRVPSWMKLFGGIELSRSED